MYKKKSTVSSADFLIVGAGIVGMCVAFELKQRNPNANIIILEKEHTVGVHASGRNSGILHSGIYYGSDTLKAKVCSSGARLMREFASEYGIACQRSGKIIIATSESDLVVLEQLFQNAKKNRISVEKLTEQEIKKIEPHATPYQLGLYCSDTSVIDSKAIINKLYELLTQSGVRFEFNSPLVSVIPRQKIVVTPRQNYQYGYFFNCAGAYADKIAKKFHLGMDYTLIPFKGIYYKLRSDRSHLVRSNIYPVPNINLPFLGVHLTRVINGDVFVGPTAIPAFGRENYNSIKGIKLTESLPIISKLFGLYFANQQNFRKLVHTEMLNYFKSYFVKMASKLVNDLKESDLLSCNKIGIRPQLINNKKKKLEMDYIIEQTPDSLHVLNAISPAFTSAFAFAKMLLDKSAGIAGS